MRNRVQSAIFAAILFGASGSVSQSAVLATATEVGGDVVIVASGSLNLAAWTTGSAGFSTDNLEPVDAALILGSSGPDVFDALDEPLNYVSSASYGTGPNVDASSGSGDVFGIRNFTPDIQFLLVPQGYLSGGPLAATMTFDNATFDSLGIEPGTYIWSWGTGSDADSMTLNIVPEPSAVLLLLLGSLGVSTLRRRRC